MSKLRPAQQRPPAKKLTPEVLRDNPILGKLARIRLKQLKEARLEQQNSARLEQKLRLI